MKPPMFASTAASAGAAFAAHAALRSQRRMAQARSSARVACAQTPTLTPSEET